MLGVIVVGISRATLIEGHDDIRTVLRLHPALAPYKAAVLPLSKKLADKGREIQ